MIPLRDVMPSPRVPVITIALIAAQLALWLSGALLPHGVFAANLAAPLEGWRHTTWLHLGANLWCLWIFGDNVEGRIGRLPFLVAYGLCGACALFVERALTPAAESLIAGSSGATAGVMGMYFAWYPRSRILALTPSLAGWDLFELPAAALLAVWFTLQLLALHAPTAAGGPALAAIAVMFAAGAGTSLLLGGRRRYPAW